MIDSLGGAIVDYSKRYVWNRGEDVWGDIIAWGLPKAILNNRYEYGVYLYGGYFSDSGIAGGIKGGMYVFSDRVSAERFVGIIEGYRGIDYVLVSGRLVRFRCIARLVFRYRGKKYEVEKDMGMATGAQWVKDYFRIHNGSCDCNRSSFIRRRYKSFRQMKCGKKIELESIYLLIKKEKFVKGYYSC